MAFPVFFVCAVCYVIEVPTTHQSLVVPQQILFGGDNHAKKATNTMKKTMRTAKILSINQRLLEMLCQ